MNTCSQCISYVGLCNRLCVRLVNQVEGDSLACQYFTKCAYVISHSDTGERRRQTDRNQMKAAA